MVIATPARANLALRGIPEASITKMNGARAAERVREDREKILSLRKVFVSGPWYTTSGVDVGSFGEAERRRYGVSTIGTRGLSLRVHGKPCTQGREMRNNERCILSERPEAERMRKTGARKRMRFPEGAVAINAMSKLKSLLPARLELAIFG